MTDSTTVGVRLHEYVAEEIRVLLARKRMSASALAKQMNVSQTYVWRRLTGETALDLSDLEKIARLLDVHVVDLFPKDKAEATVTYLGDHAADHSGPMSERPHGTRRPGGRHDPTGPGRATRVHPAIAA